jgi:hypothetical protein
MNNGKYANLQLKKSVDLGLVAATSFQVFFQRTTLGPEEHCG